MKTKAILSIVLFVLCLSGAEAQNADRIVLTTDKESYYPGEHLWFSFNVFDACSDTLSNLSKVAYVELIGSDNKPVQQLKIAVSHAHGSGSFIISDQVPTGNYSLIAYTNRMKNFGPHTFCRNNVRVVNPLKISPLHVSNNAANNLSTSDFVKLGKKTFMTRERIPVSVTAPSSSRVSVSVIKIDALQNGLSSGISPAPVENPCGGLSATSGQFLSEELGHIISARVTDKQSGLPAAGVRGYMSVINSPDKLFVATSDSAGVVRFQVGALTGKKELVLQTEPELNKTYSIELLNPYAEHHGQPEYQTTTSVFDTMSAAISEAMVSAQVQTYFNPPASPVEDTTHLPGIPFYGKHDDFYLMSDYVHFTTVEEILREYVTAVGVQVRTGSLLPVVYDVLADRKPFAVPPLILVNGVPVFDIDRFMGLNTDNFYSIAVVGKRYFMGRQTWYGIVDVRLNTSLKEFGKDATVVDYDALAPAKQFSFTNYNDDSLRRNRKPDFRNVLYWNPLLEPETDGTRDFEFYTSDLDGEYAIVVNVVSEKGVLQTSQTLIQVQ